MNEKMMKFDFNDILLEPAETSFIKSRQEIIPYYFSFSDKVNEPRLPIIAAPMDTVVNSKNYNSFLDNKINVCLPRKQKPGAPYEHNLFKELFYSYSLEEFNERFLGPQIRITESFVLIDVANGHMNELELSIKKAKEKYGNTIFLMVGNIANPKTYVRLSNAGADAIRIGIGNGQACLTTQQTSIGAASASLIRECYEESIKLNNPALIIADGGMKNYSDIIKSLALGANYVMIGSIFNKALESCGQTYVFNKFKVEQDSNLAKWLFKNNFTLTKKFRGMSTKEVQKNWGNKNLKTAEGIVKFQKVEYTLSGWVENFEHYLRSAMSYCGASNLKEFIGHANYNIISPNAYERFKK